MAKTGRDEPETTALVISGIINSIFSCYWVRFLAQQRSVTFV